MIALSRISFHSGGRSPWWQGFSKSEHNGDMIVIIKIFYQEKPWNRYVVPNWKDRHTCMHDKHVTWYKFRKSFKETVFRGFGGGQKFENFRQIIPRMLGAGPPFLSLRISLQMSRKSWRNMRPISSQFIAEENLDFTTEKQTSRERAGMPKIYQIKKRD